MKNNNIFFSSIIMSIVFGSTGCNGLRAETKIASASPCRVVTISKENIESSGPEIYRLIGKERTLSYQYIDDGKKVIVLIDTINNNSTECDNIKNIVNQNNQSSKSDAGLKTTEYSPATDTNLGIQAINTSEESLVVKNPIDSCSPLAYRIYSFKLKKLALKKQQILQEKFSDYAFGIKYYKKYKMYRIYIWGFESKEEILPILKEMKIKNPKYIKEGLNICNGSILNNVEVEVKSKPIPQNTPIVSPSIRKEVKDSDDFIKNEESVEKINDGLLNMCKPFEETKDRLLARGATQRAIDKITRDLAECLKKKEYFETLK